MIERRQKAYFGHVSRIGLDEPIARHTQFTHQQKLVVFQVFEPTPHQVGGFLAGKSGEISSLHQTDFGPSGG